ncbi:MAG: hypothetical protein AB4290_08190 [Spirulina sp.]
MTLNCLKICRFLRKNWQSLLWESLCIVFAKFMLEIGFHELFVTVPQGGITTRIYRELYSRNWQELLTIAWSIVFFGAILCLSHSLILIGLTVRGKSESDKLRDRMGQFGGLLAIVGGFFIVLILIYPIFSIDFGDFG